MNSRWVFFLQKEHFILVFLPRLCDDEISFCTRTRLRLARSDADILLGRLRTREMAKRGAAIDTSCLAETLELRRQRANTTEHFGSWISHLNGFVFPSERIMRYTTVVDPGVSYDPRQFADEIAIYLADPDGWVSRGITFVASTRHPEMVIHLTPQSKMRAIGCDSHLSCAEFNGREVHLNANRWLHGAPASRLALSAYRQYMVTHEVGHILGYDHQSCPGRGQPAPVMVQQTLGIGVCKPNTRLTVYDRK